MSLGRFFRIEIGQTEPTKDEVATLAAFFEVKPSRFYTARKAEKAA